MQQWRRFVRRRDLLLKVVTSRREPEHLVLSLALGHDAVEHQVEELPAPRLDLAQFALRRGQIRALLHAQPVHLFRELAAELVKEIRSGQLLLQRAQHSPFDFLTRNREPVVACSAVAASEAPEMLARVDDEAGAADAALRQAREQILGSSELIESS